MHKIPTAMTAAEVADLLATVAAANSRIAAEADRIFGARGAVNLATIVRLTRLFAELRPGAEARAQLARLDPGLLLAGTSVWLIRRRMSIAAMSATECATARWGVGARELV